VHASHVLRAIPYSACVRPASVDSFPIIYLTGRRKSLFCFYVRAPAPCTLHIMQGSLFFTGEQRNIYSHVTSGLGILSHDTYRSFPRTVRMNGAP
jgi:hypothetical protein